MANKDEEPQHDQDDADMDTGSHAPGGTDTLDAGSVHGHGRKGAVHGSQVAGNPGNPGAGGSGGQGGGSQGGGGQGNLKGGR